MREELHTGLSPDALAVLSDLKVEDSHIPQVEVEEKTSLKDRPYLDILREQPELEALITDVMKKLEDEAAAVPIFHITSRAIRYSDGSEQSTGYLENIAQQGLRPKDTNVAALMEREPVTQIAEPSYFKENPHKLLRSMSTSLQHYAHHGSRTNKASLENQRDQGKGTPVMLIIDPSNLALVSGTDYDDHFMLAEVADPSLIIGVVELTGRKVGRTTDVAEITRDYLQTIQDHLNSQLDV